MKRHIVRAALATAAATATLTGCQTKPATPTAAAPAQPLADVKPTAAAAPATQPSTAAAPDARVVAEALVYKSQNWTREIEPLMNKRVRKTAEPTDVDFLDPSDFRLGPALVPTVLNSAKRHEPVVQVAAIAHPVSASTPTIPNQGVALATTSAETGPTASQIASNSNYPRSLNETTADRSSITPAKAAAGSELDSILTKNLKDYPKDVWAHLDFQLLQFLKDKPTPQLDALATLPAEDRELVAAVMDALSNFRNGVRADSNMLMSRKVRPLLDLAGRVRAQADLIIPTMTLCTRVDGFGVYEPVEPARFTAMKEHPIIVYCEVENFSSHINDKKMWETKLSQEVVLYTETGLPVWQDKTENIPDLARNRRHDFFVVKKTKFPPNITIGRYILKVTIVDQQSNRMSEATLPVLFVAQ